MIYKQLSYLPIIFQVDEGIIYNIPDFLRRNNLNFNRVLIISGRTWSHGYASVIATSNSWETYVLGDNSIQDVIELKSYCELQGYDLLIAIGGGKVLDAVKRVSYLTNINHLSVPTIISNDGLISPISVIRNENGKTESIPGMMPMGVVIDLDVIMTSPSLYIRAAAGDILSNLSATNDWILASIMRKDKINDIGFHLSKSAANSLLHFNKIDLKSKPFIRMVIQGQINSGIAMALAGTSRPCSGSEHLISHALDYLDLTDNVLHGIQVASVSLFTLFLQGKLQDIHLDYAVATQIPLCFTTFLKDDGLQVLKLIYSKAKEMRPGRYTILDEIDLGSFITGIGDYKCAINEYNTGNKINEN